jgi:hypothetical protein
MCGTFEGSLVALPALGGGPAQRRRMIGEGLGEVLCLTSCGGAFFCGSLSGFYIVGDRFEVQLASSRPVSTVCLVPSMVDDETGDVLEHHLWAGSKDGVLSIFDARATLLLEAPCDASPLGVTSIGYVEATQRVWAAMGSGSVAIWEVETWKWSKVFRVSQKIAPTALAVLPRFVLITAENARQVRLWALDSGPIDSVQSSEEVGPDPLMVFEAPDERQGREDKVEEVEVEVGEEEVEVGEEEVVVVTQRLGGVFDECPKCRLTVAKCEASAAAMLAENEMRHREEFIALEDEIFRLRKELESKARKI